ncbi:DnaB-like helicase C-terminal domain-containing protein [Streptomyces sp. NPDC058394]|uniref:DnaB-like helicase C-terminal domain-containing protein n=1 Tax=Streptomyces sp. NPDC058394 TaxID=3346477 RepID=UPI0036589490
MVPDRCFATDQRPVSGSLAEWRASRCAFFSLEMSRTELHMRLLSAEGSIGLHHIRSGNLDETAWTRMAKAKAKIDASNLLLDDSPELTAMTIRTKGHHRRQPEQGTSSPARCAPRSRRSSRMSQQPTSTTTRSWSCAERWSRAWRCAAPRRSRPPRSAGFPSGGARLCLPFGSGRQNRPAASTGPDPSRSNLLPGAALW